MNSNIRIQQLGAGDAEAFWHLRLEALQTEPHAYGASVEEHQAMTIEQTAVRLQPSPDGSCVVGAYDGDALIGIVGFVREVRPKTRHKGVVWGMYVKGSYRGRGIGRALMRAVIDRARTCTNLKQVTITVAATQPAAAHLYRSLGFQQFGREPDALKIGSDYVDEEWMVLPLND